MNSITDSSFRTFSPIYLSLFYVILLISCQQNQLVISENDATNLKHWLEENHRTPGEVISGELKEGRSIILIQDHIIRADTIDLMKALIPVSYDQGVREIGLFFMASENQNELDLFMENDSNSISVEEGLFSSNMALGYVEYRNFLAYIKDFNQRLRKNESPVHLKALGKNGTTSAAILSRMLQPEGVDHNSIPPVFLWIPGTDMHLLPERQAPDTVPDSKLSPTSVTIAHHGPWNGALRWNGLIESICKQRDIRDRTFAFKTDAPPFRSWNDERQEIKTDIYVVTSYRYRAVSVIPNFITPDIALRALKFFPKINMEKPLFWITFRMNRTLFKATKKYNQMIRNLTFPDIPGE